MKKILYTSAIIVTMVPMLVFAAPSPTTPATANVDTCSQKIQLNTLGNIFNWASCTIVRSVIPLLFTLAVVGFIWGIIQYFLYPENEEKRKAGKSFMLWGIIALFVMVSIWGLVGILTNTFGVKTLIPQLSQ